RERVDGLEVLEVGRGVERLDRDALGSLTDEPVGIALELLLGERAPFGERAPLRLRRAAGRGGVLILGHAKRVRPRSRGRPKRGVRVRTGQRLRGTTSVSSVLRRYASHTRWSGGETGRKTHA